MYVLKFSGAGQGPKVLVAELIAGEIGRAVGLRVPEIVFAELDAELARTEPDEEIQDLIRASAGRNLGLDYLPGSVTFDPVVDAVDGALASSVVWFDAFVSNVDRTPRNTNMLVWHHDLWLIDHGSALYFHHADDRFLDRSDDPFPLIRNHVLLEHAGALRDVDERLTQRITPEVVGATVENVPDEWLERDAEDPVRLPAADQREQYAAYLLERLERPHRFLEEAVLARAAL